MKPKTVLSGSSTGPRKSHTRSILSYSCRLRMSEEREKEREIKREESSYELLLQMTSNLRRERVPGGCHH
jgi:hypothetical protein